MSGFQITELPSLSLLPSFFKAQKAHRFVVITRERKTKQDLQDCGRSSYKHHSMVNTLYKGWLRYLGQH